MTAKPRIREARSAGGTAVGEALRMYLVQTEMEKAEQGVGGRLSATSELPAAYRAEAEDPARALSGCLVLVAELNQIVCGVVVLKRHAGSSEIKRLWSSPEVRGRGVGSALLDAAIASAGPAAVTLTVWDWRGSAISMYESRGFARVTSWDERPRLICTRRDAPDPTAAPLTR